LSRYDFKNVIDLMLYLFPMADDATLRHGSTTRGSGIASRIICSSLISQLSTPCVSHLAQNNPCRQPTSAASRRDPSLVTLSPRDFDFHLTSRW